jgi:NAD(P)-dependent dehydrogenase (short-subunit alcohol dehydrogenase family)
MVCILIGLIIFIYVSYRLYQYFFPTPDINPNGKYVLISGCDTGFGNGLAIELDRQGFNVLAGIYNLDNKESLTKILSSRATVFKLDVTRQEDIDAAYEMISNKTKVLHALVNNAGIGAGGLIDWISVDFIRNMMDVNFFGHVTMTKKFLPLLIAKRDSRVVNICSVAGYLTKPGMSAYSASKYALESFSDCLRREMAVWNLRVSIIEPGFMRTAIVEGHDKNVRNLWNGLPDDVKERWGEEQLDKQIREIENNPFMKHAENPAKVVQVLKHAVMNTVPRIRYRPGWQSSFVMFPMSRGPAWLVDFLMIRPSLKGVPPAGVRKQLTE